MSITEEIAEGITLLNQRNPGWAQRINIDTLDMASYTKDVLGQLYGSYQEGRAVLNLDFSDNPFCGFCLRDHDLVDTAEYRSFTKQWKNIIKHIQEIPEGESFEVEVVWML